MEVLVPEVMVGPVESYHVKDTAPLTRFGRGVTTWDFEGGQ